MSEVEVNVMVEGEGIEGHLTMRASPLMVELKKHLFTVRATTESQPSNETLVLPTRPFSNTSDPDLTPPTVRELATAPDPTHFGEERLEELPLTMTARPSALEPYIR